MKRIILAFLAFSSLYGASPPQHIPPPPRVYQPLFTGTLLTTSPNVVQGGHVDIEPYLFVNTNYGKYNANWSNEDVADLQYINPQFFAQIGLTKFMDFAITPQFFTQISGGEVTTAVGDFLLEFDFQLLHGGGKDLKPSLLLNLSTLFPVSKYRNLNPNKNGTDAIGAGTYEMAIELVFGKNFDFGGTHYFATRYAVNYSYSTPVHVTGFNTYGGGNGTFGTVYPGNGFNFFAGFEYSLTRNWVLALDVQYQHVNRNRFSGVNGVLRDGTPATSAAPSSEMFSLAPAIEYNWSEMWGLIAGVWFSVAGRNTSAFASGVVALNYYK